MKSRIMFYCFLMFFVVASFLLGQELKPSYPDYKILESGGGLFGVTKLYFENLELEIIKESKYWNTPVSIQKVYHVKDNYGNKYRVTSIKNKKLRNIHWDNGQKILVNATLIVDYNNMKILDFIEIQD